VLIRLEAYPLKKGKAFFVVSARRLGKSQTLMALTGGITARRFTIEGTRFVVRRMSNDEDDEGFFDLLDNTYPDSAPHVILAMCPTFNDGRRRELLMAALNAFGQRYEMFFFVLGRQETHPGKLLPKHQIEPLKALGALQVFNRSVEGESRARAFKKFIVANL
jgi:hypothetical protein